MSTPFTGSIIGSWLFFRSNQPGYDGTMVYHFDADGGCHWELFMDNGRIITSLGYSHAGSLLTLKYKSGSTADFELIQESDGSVQVPSPGGKVWWWMRRMDGPLPCSIAFMNDEGVLVRSLGA